MSDLAKSYETAYRSTVGIQLLYSYIQQHGRVTDYTFEDLELAITGYALCLSQEETRDKMPKLDLNFLAQKTGISTKSMTQIVEYVQTQLLPKVAIPPMTVTPFQKHGVVFGGLAFVNSERVQQLMRWYHQRGGKMEDILDTLCYYQRIGLGTKHMSTVDKQVYVKIAATMPDKEVVEGCASPLDYIYPKYCSPRSADVAQYGSQGSIFPYLKNLNRPVLLLLNPPHTDRFVQQLIPSVAEYLKSYYAQGAAVVYILPDVNNTLELYVQKGLMKAYRFEDKRVIYCTMNVPDLAPLFTKAVRRPRFSIPEESSSCFSINLDSYINSYKQIFVPYETVQGCNNISILLAGAISTGKIEYPYVSSFLALEQVKQLTRNDTSSRFIPLDIRANWATDVPDVAIGLNGTYYVITYLDSDYEKLGIITDYFTGKARAQGQWFNERPPIELWMKKSVQIATRSIEYSKRNKVPLDTRVLSEGLYLARIPMCTNFKIGVAMLIYRLFNSIIVDPQNSNIDTTNNAKGSLVCFDPFGGWGDRAISASLSGVVSRYICTDSNENLREGYGQIKEFFESLRPDCQIEQHITPIENFDLEANLPSVVDLVFSGPPYFNVETYSPCKGQSNIDHPEFPDWLFWFVTQTLRVINKIRQYGYLVYYLANHEHNITSPLIQAIYESKLAEFIGTIPIIREGSSKERRPILLYVWRRI